VGKLSFSCLFKFAKVTAFVRFLLPGRRWNVVPPCRYKIYLLTFVRLVIYPFPTMRGGMKTAKLTALALAFFLCFGWMQPSLLSLCLASGQNDMKNCSHCENMSMKTADKACSKSAAPEQEDAGAGDSCSMQICYAPQILLGADMPQLSLLVPQVALPIPRADILVSSMHVNDLFRPPAPSAA
jgi:hypothetical protein